MTSFLTTIQSLQSALPDRPFQWREWDCFQVARWTRSYLAPQLPTLPNDIYEKYPVEGEGDLNRILIKEVAHKRKSGLLYQRLESEPIGHLDLLILQSQNAWNLATAIVDSETDETTDVWITMIGEYAHCLPLRRMTGTGIVSQVIAFQLKIETV